MKNIFLSFLFIVLLGSSIVFSSCSDNDDSRLAVQNSSKKDNNVNYEYGYKASDIKALFSEVNSRIAENGVNNINYPLIYRSIYPFASTKNLNEDPVFLIDQSKKNSSVFLNKLILAISLSKENNNKDVFLQVFENEDEKKAALLVLDFLEKESAYLNDIAVIASNNQQTKAQITGCDVAAAVSSILIADMAAVTGVGAAVGGFLGIGAAWGAALVGAVGGLAYTAAFC